MTHKYGKSTHPGKKISLNQQDLAIFSGCFNATIFQLALVRYEMIIAMIANYLSSRIQCALLE